MAAGPQPTDVIDDVRDPRLRKVAELLKGKNPKSRAIIIDDEENVAEALRQGVDLFTVFLTDTDQLEGDLLDRLPPEVNVQFMSVRVSKELFKVERQSRLFALARKPKPWTVADLLNQPGDVIVLDGVRLMGNIGAITRSTRALGFSGIVLLDSALNSVTDRRLIRASRGMVFGLPLVLATSDELLEQLADHDITVVSLEPDATTELPEIARIPGRVAVLLGSEKHGPSQVMSQRADQHVGIAIHPDVESLNVSVTAALAMYQRRHANPLPGA